MTATTRDAILGALKDQGDTIKAVAKRTGLSYSQVYRAMKDMAAEGAIKEAGKGPAGAKTFSLSNGHGKEAAPSGPVFEAPLGLGESLKVTEITMRERDGEPESIIELEDPSSGRHVKALVLTD